MTQTFPLLPLRDIVVFPKMVAPLFVGRTKSVRALEEVDSENGEIMLVAQRDATTDDPAAADLHDLKASAWAIKRHRLGNVGLNLNTTAKALRT